MYCAKIRQMFPIVLSLREGLTMLDFMEVGLTFGCPNIVMCFYF